MNNIQIGPSITVNQETPESGNTNCHIRINHFLQEWRTSKMVRWLVSSSFLAITCLVQQAPFFTFCFMNTLLMFRWADSFGFDRFDRLAP